MVSTTCFSIFSYNYNFFNRRTDALPAEQVGDNIYKVSFPFLGGSVVFEKTIDQFKSENPTKNKSYLYSSKSAQVEKSRRSYFLYSDGG